MIHLYLAEVSNEEGKSIVLMGQTGGFRDAELLRVHPDGRVELLHGDEFSNLRRSMGVMVHPHREDMRPEPKK